MVHSSVDSTDAEWFSGSYCKAVKKHERPFFQGSLHNYKTSGYSCKPGRKSIYLKDLSSSPISNLFFVLETMTQVRPVMDRSDRDRGEQSVKTPNLSRNL